MKRERECMMMVALYESHSLSLSFSLFLSLLCLFSRTKFASDTWMRQLGYMEPASKPNWWGLPLSSLHLGQPASCGRESSCSQAVDTMSREKINQLPITDKDG